MKNLTMKIVGTAAVLALSTPTFAQDNQKSFYGSVGYFFGSYEVEAEPFDPIPFDILDAPDGADIGDFTVTSTGDFESDVDSILLRFGYQFHPNFSVEARYGIGAGSDTGSADVSITDATVNVEGGAIAGPGGGAPADITNIVAEIEADTELDDLYGIFLRAGVSAGRFYPYAIIGYTEGEGEASKPKFVASGDVVGVTDRQSLVSTGTITEDETESDFSYGIGTDFRFTDSLAMNAEWMSYLDKDGAKIGGFQLGLVYSF